MQVVISVGCFTFVFSTIGAAQADVAILVINAARGEFETGFEAGGQTREHAMLVRSLGKKFTRISAIIYIYI